MNEPFSVYVHLPYCVSKCPYCDFNSWEAESTTHLEEEYIEALKIELLKYRNTFTGEIQTVFFGGGTPSLFSSKSITSILQAIKDNFPVSATVEASLEANPGSIHESNSVEKLSGYREGGINRLSMGVQSFSEEKLKFLGRKHSKENSISSIENIIKSGFTNFNLDLIFGCKDETLSEWQDDLQEALSFSPPHISAYSLTIEPGTAFGRIEKKGGQLLAKDSVQAEMFQITNTLVNDSGLQRYEISNFSKPGLECKHNVSYWRGLNYLGIGAGAFSSYFDTKSKTKRRWRNQLNPEKYCSLLRESKSAKLNQETLDQSQIATEFVFLSLRTKWGMDIETYSSYFPRENLDKETLKNLISLKDGKAHLTEQGYLFSNLVFEELC